MSAFVTVIYVFEPTTVQVESSEDNLALQRYLDLPDAAPKIGRTMTIAPGVYRILSKEAVKVVVPEGTKAETFGKKGKDGWPTPPPKVKDVLRYDLDDVYAFVRADRGQ